ncbi:hypothetical protein F9B85_12050 [Heliorestis acidaminivorans]|uniref:SAM-dependent MTase RsmB/NOP-type domain-containing protein n=1 Tax=Heliorestis acidaminivorans TaxID=553427 RepID=A0A6I0ENX9_9FIRM|nr:hypothetical protein [Heliorestis acidaminivorans]KAB2951531.1 hypothetical protein F9B85_12050 [Heliorestis acidaminivorans]
MSKKVNELLELETEELKKRISEMSEEEFDLIYSEASISTIENWEKIQKLLDELRKSMVR